MMKYEPSVRKKSLVLKFFLVPSFVMKPQNNNVHNGNFHFFE